MAATAELESGIRYPVIGGSLAYDLNSYAGSLAPELPERELERPRPQTRTAARKKVKAQQRVALFSVLGYAAVAGLLILLIFSYVQLYEISSASVELKTQLEELKSEQSLLMSQYEGSINLNEVEQEATTRLGMSQPQSEQIFYVDLSRPDKAEIVSEKRNTARVETVLGAIKSSVSYILEYFS